MILSVVEGFGYCQDDFINRGDRSSENPVSYVLEKETFTRRAGTDLQTMYA